MKYLSNKKDRRNLKIYSLRKAGNPFKIIAEINNLSVKWVREIYNKLERAIDHQNNHPQHGRYYDWRVEMLVSQAAKEICGDILGVESEITVGRFGRVEGVIKRAMLIGSRNNFFQKHLAK